MSDLYREQPECPNSPSLDGNHVESRIDHECMGCGIDYLPVVKVEQCEHGNIDGHPVDNPPDFDWCPDPLTLEVDINVTEVTAYRCDVCGLLWPKYLGALVCVESHDTVTYGQVEVDDEQ